MSRSFRRDHGDVHICRRNDTAEVDIETMRKHQHIAFLKVRLDVVFVEVCLLLIVDQDHDDICFFSSLRSRKHLKTLFFCLLPGSAALIQTNDHMAGGLF